MEESLNTGVPIAMRCDAFARSSGFHMSIVENMLVLAYMTQRMDMTSEGPEQEQIEHVEMGAGMLDVRSLDQIRSGLLGLSFFGLTGVRSQLSAMSCS